MINPAKMKSHSLCDVFLVMWLWSKFNE